MGNITYIGLVLSLWWGSAHDQNGVYALRGSCNVYHGLCLAAMLARSLMHAARILIHGCAVDRVLIRLDGNQSYFAPLVCWQCLGLAITWGWTKLLRV